GGQITVHWEEMIRGIVADARRHLPAGILSRRFHDTLASATLAAVSRLAGTTGARHVVLSGGVFQNVTLLSRILSGLQKRKLTPLIHRGVPANDGGISLGQAYYAATQVAGG
ncbi:MAG: (NiFe) hydrogenase maturation protein HypF, partial [Deltaproteobacteria bacterium]|nr:(NiFe) hydrogenase maturation protein HypF [Deltaproteobacteria bacterium]